MKRAECRLRNKPRPGSFQTMLEILEEPLVRENVSPISVRFYHEAGAAGMISEDVELLEGVIVKKMSKSPLHEFIVARLLRRLSEVLQPGIFAAKERPITTPDSEPEPDIAVIEGQEDDFFDHHPTTAQLVIEVAVTTLEIDRRKAAIYSRAGVGEYWIVDAENRTVELFRNPVVETGEYEQKSIFRDGERGDSRIISGFEIDLGALFDR